MKKVVRGEAKGTEPRTRGAVRETICVTATVARKEFGRLLDLIAEDQQVIITRYGVATAVMVPVDRFDVPAAADTAMLDVLTAEFDALFESMQTPEARAAMDRVFNASPEEPVRILAAGSPG